MKFVVCVVHSRDKNKVTDEMIRAGYKFTVISSTGGFLREGNTTILVGVGEEDTPALLNLIEQNCQAREQLLNVMPLEAAPTGAFLTSPVKVPVGGAVVFVLNVERFERF
ncbi:MAG: cyclic-di-AMP receptor [Fimbriimonadaceae bacterium]|nr:cyclic-di-AMP receptor [Fimbriimonadaceae bacterium]QOJ11620.1 MAG: cyclic-di-AMP receptor [Chthonomonadaceae bacterium]